MGERCNVWEKHATKTGKKSSAYDIVKSFTENTLGKFSKQDALLSCPSLGSSSVESALKKLVEEGAIYSACISTDFSVLFLLLKSTLISGILKVEDYKFKEDTTHQA